MRNTIRNVTTVVPVLMTNCHVSEKRKTGPVMHQTKITSNAMMKAVDVPVALVALYENPSRISLSAFLFFLTIVLPPKFLLANAVYDSLPVNPGPQRGQPTWGGAVLESQVQSGKA